MSTGDTLKNFFELIAQGSSEHLQKAYDLLLEANLFVPVTFSTVNGSSGGVEKYSVPTFTDKGTVLLPVFSSEDFFNAWSAGRYECLSVPGESLSLVVPRDSCLVINPGNECSVRISAEDLANIAQLAAGEFEVREDAELSSAVVEPLEPSQDNLASANIEKMEFSLVKLLERYEEVAEAYYLDRRTKFSDGSLGLLAENLTADRRFRLIADIGEISRKYCGTAGAIEVYDDLSSTLSHSWELFSSLTPFYVRMDSADCDDLPIERRQRVASPRFFGQKF
ncbi:MAG: SseB family protein [Deltaproteobacteria bacterium]|nr:SseB family protein [Deltaproteobacteria bacterium]